MMAALACATVGMSASTNSDRFRIGSSRIDCYHTAMVATAPIDWSRIDTVLLDMDGTLLDLRFDNWFWQELIPRHYGAAHGMDALAAAQLIERRFAAARGTIQWYCIEHWSRELGLDIAGIKRSTQAEVKYLPGAEDFLVRLKGSGKRRVLVTNAHPETLAIKNRQVGLTPHFDAWHSTHAFEIPKEDRDFWPRLMAKEPFDAGRTLFVDDSLPVLDAAREFGIGWIRAIRCPDSGRGPQATGDHDGVDRIAELL
jgi:putative hydrolase of the HAD superfamily